MITSNYDISNPIAACDCPVLTADKQPVFLFCLMGFSNDFTISLFNVSIHSRVLLRH